MYADVLPAEQVLALLGVLSVAPSRGQRDRPIALLGALAVAASLLGFAFQSGVFHQQLRARDGGAPMFDDGISDARPEARDALLLLDTDHGFNLAYDPAHRRVARFHGDDLDRLTWEARERPRTFRYRRARDSEPARLLAVLFDPQPTAERELVIEAESLWPPAHQQRGWAWPSHVAAHCAGGGRVLALYPTSGESELRVRLPRGLDGRTLRLRAMPDLAGTGENNSMKLTLYRDETVSKRWRVGANGDAECIELSPAELPNGAAELTLSVRATGPVAIDSLKFSEKR